MVLAWDVRQTTYDVRDGVLSRGGRAEQVRDHAADPVLREELPGPVRPGGAVRGLQQLGLGG